ncbi:SDR family oxidoreductase [Rhodococcus koreensis]|uniref:SDR family oxidoreductase n=1 Tax=Rhodococcus koreensis TaxID=99653 RepID=UPI003670DA0C
MIAPKGRIMSDTERPLDRQTALITGGAGGLGKRVAATLAERGVKVVLVDVNSDALERASEVLRQEVPTGTFVGVQIDVTDSSAVRSAVEATVADNGSLDILVTSHGFPKDGRLLEMSDNAWSDVVNVCLTGTFVCVREAARPMVEQSYGRIITVASRAWHGNPGQANYSAAKAGVIGLTRSVAKELGRYSITANSIAPGLIETPSLRNLERFEQIAERARKDNSIKRLGVPNDVAAAVGYLASPDAGFVTGEVLHVSGGRFG